MVKSIIKYLTINNKKSLPELGTRQFYGFMIKYNVLQGFRSMKQCHTFVG